MPHPTLAEKFELLALAGATALTAWLGPAAGIRLELGELIAGAALLLLLQGLVRDLWLWRESRRRPPPAPPREARCMCVESALGLTGVVAGIGLVGFGLDLPVGLSATGVTATTGAVLAGGFVLKDFVFEWSPWRIYREKNHAQVILRWRK